MKNIAPYDLTLASATWSGGQASTDASGNLVVPEGTSVTWTGTFRDPGTGDTHNIVIDWGDGNFESATPTRDTQDPALVRFTFTHAFADDHPDTGMPSDLVHLKIQVRDDDTGTAGVEPKARIANVAPAVSVAPATLDVQYSDPIAKIVLTAADARGIAGPGQSFSETLQASTRWKVDNGAWQDGLFDALTWSAGGCEVSGLGALATQTCTWSVEGLVNVAPGAYVIEFTVVDDDTGTTANFAAWAENGLLVAANAWDHAFVPETNLVLGKLQVHFK